MPTCSRRASSRPPSTAATTGTPPFTATGCSHAPPPCFPKLSSPLRHVPHSRRVSPRRTSRSKWRICAARDAPHSSAPTALPGSCSSRRSCAVGTTRRRARGPKRCSRSSWKPPRGSRAICRSCAIRSASASTARPRLRSGSSGIGRRVTGDQEMRALLQSKATHVLPHRPQLSHRLRAFRRGFPFAVSRGGGFHAARAGAG